jgi:hypothetical protein
VSDAPALAGPSPPRRAAGRRAWAALLVALALPGAAGASCPAWSGAPGRTLESARYRVTYRTSPPRTRVGQHFSVELAVCGRDGAAAPEAVAVDARMPEHRHGMNYRTTVTPQADGRYRADGLMFHMPGRWELTFDVRAAGRTDRLTETLEAE